MKSSTIQLAIEIIGAIGVFSMGIGYIYTQFIVGKHSRVKDDLQTENDLTTYLKNQVNGYKEIAETQNKKIAEMDKEMSTFKAIIAEKDKTIEKYLEILQGRNPELEDILKDIAASMTDIKSFMKHIDTHLENSGTTIETKTTTTKS